MEMKFEKYTGIGNDFIITDYDVTVKDVIKLCNRRFGIGADGLIKLTQKDNLYYMTFFNSDGSYAPMCGNGIRCYTHYLYNNNLIKGNSVNIDTKSGIKHIEYKVENEEFKVRVNMGVSTKDSFNNEIKILDRTFSYSYTYTGTDHIVIFVDKNELNEEFVIKYGSLIQKEKDANVNFVNVKSRDNIDVITYERGAGLTLACGTGACASAYISNYYNYTDNNMKVNLLGGNLDIELSDSIYMTGKSEYLFKGSVML